LFHSLRVSLELCSFFVGFVGYNELMPKNIKLFFVFLLCVFFASPSMAHAQQSAPFDLSVSPSVVELTLQPGKLVTQTYLIENSGTTDLSITPLLKDFGSDGKTGTPVLSETSTFPYAELQNADIKMETPFVLKANSSQQLILAIKPTNDAVERDWYVSLVLQARPVVEESLAVSGTSVTGQLVSNLLIRVAQTDQASLKWDLELQGIPRFIDSLQSITITPFVKNLSNTAAIPEMSVLVIDWRGNIVFEQDGLPERVLAQSSREIAAALQRKDDPRSYQPSRFSFDPLFAVGPYTVRTTIRNNESGPKVVEKSFVAFPFSVLLAIIFLGVSFLSLSKWRRRQARQRQS
jgi:hypothetical protein